MSVWAFIKVFTDIRNFQLFHADDSIDKLNRSTTVIFLIVSVVLITTQSLVGPTIHCNENVAVTSVKFSSDYVNSMCYAKSTYHIDHETHVQTHITYYQWLQVILLFIALLYYLPYVIWKYLLRAHVGRNKTSGMPIDISGIITLLNETEVYKIKEFNKTVSIASDYLHHCFVLNESDECDLIDYDIDNGTVNRTSRNQRPRRNGCLQRLGSYSIIAKYFLIKIAYIANSVAVFWFMNLFLKFDSGFVFYGWRVVNALVQDNVADMNALWESKYFPRAVTCKLKVRQQDEIYPEFSFNCGLPANVFNEKIFMVLWTWFTIVLVFNLYGLFKWFHRLVQRKRILVDYMGCILQSNAFNSRNSLVDTFLDDYVSIDGFFAFEMIRENTSNVCTRRLVERLWKTYSDSCTANLDNFQTPKNSDSKTKKGDYNDDRSPTPNVVPTSADVQPSRKNFSNTGNSADDKDAQRNLLQKSDKNLPSYSPFKIIKPNNDIV